MTSSFQLAFSSLRLICLTVYHACTAISLFFCSYLDDWDVDLALMAGVHLGLFLIFGRWLGERDGMGMTKKFVHDLANGLAVEDYVWNRGRNVHDTARSSIIFLG